MKKILFLTMITALLFSACRSSKSVHNRYYLLEIPDDAMERQQRTEAPIAGKCEILPVKVAPVYATHQIALREESHSIMYFTFNEWAQRPESRFTDMLIYYLETHNIFEKIATGRLDQPADHVFETRVHRMLVDHQQGLFIAEFDIEFILRDASTGLQLFNHHASSNRELPEKNLNYFAAAVSEMFAEELRIFVFSVLNKSGF